jgi:hypothetical protein
LPERVQLPPGCGGFTTADGTRYDAKPGTSVVLEDRHADALARSQHSSIGLVTKPSTGIGTKKGRWCRPCRRLWQAWSQVCPKCGQDTVPEADMETPAGPPMVVPIPFPAA